MKTLLRELAEWPAGFALGWLSLSMLIVAGRMATDPPPIPEVVIDPIMVTEPRCRHSGMYPLGNHQKDSVVVWLICAERKSTPERRMKNGNG